MALHGSRSFAWKRIQDEASPRPKEKAGPLGKKHKNVVSSLDLVPVENFLRGRRPEVRRAIARSFLAKTV